MLEKTILFNMIFLNYSINFLIMKKYVWFALVFILLIACKKENARLNECNIENLTITPIECNSDSTYVVKIDFEHIGLDHQSFDVFIRNDELIGYYSIDSLPIILKNFKRSGKNYDLIKICINDRPDCCLVEEFLPPKCNYGDFEILGVSTQQGECTSDSTYKLTINFDDSHLPSNANFNLYTRNNKFIGKYAVKSLPLVIPSFSRSGKEYDFIKICIEGYPELCKEFEFLSPNCSSEECSIVNLKVDQGACTSDSTYSLTINFTAQNPGNDYFDVYVRKDVSIGYYKLSDLPLTIRNFKESGNSYDFIKVCINDHPDCCKALEFLTKDCK